MTDGSGDASTSPRPPGAASTRARRIAQEIGVLAAYLFLAMAVTYPLVRRFDRAFLGAGTDVFGFLWNNWWLHYAITHHLAKPYVTTFIFAPFPIDLRLHTVGFLYGLVAAPFFGWLGQIRVLNLQILATLALNGYFTFRLVRRLTRDAAIAFLCGLLAATLHAVNLHIPAGRASCGALWTAIAATSCFLSLLERPSPTASAFLTLSLVAMFLAVRNGGLGRDAVTRTLYPAHLTRRDFGPYTPCTPSWSTGWGSGCCWLHWN